MEWRKLYDENLTAEELESRQILTNPGLGIGRLYRAWLDEQKQLLERFKEKRFDA